jgi:hypothetical protein
MHGQTVHFFYNLQTGELQANDYLYKVVQAESFLINDIDQWRYTLPNALPRIEDLQKTMKNIKYNDLIKNHTSLNAYQQSITQKSKSIQKQFQSNSYNKLYIARTNEKNLFIQETLDIINTSIGWQTWSLQIAWRNINLDNTNNPIQINKSINPNEYELLMFLDRTSHSYRSPDQLISIRQQFTRLQQLIQDPIHNISQWEHPDPVVNKLFSQEALLADRENRNNPNKKSNFLLFIDLVSIPFNQQWGGILDLQLLEKVMQRIQAKEPIAITKWPKSAAYLSDPWYFNEKYQKILNENI